MVELTLSTVKFAVTTPVPTINAVEDIATLSESRTTTFRPSCAGNTEETVASARATTGIAGVPFGFSWLVTFDEVSSAVSSTEIPVNVNAGSSDTAWLYSISTSAEPGAFPFKATADNRNAPEEAISEVVAG